jgi:hypothetical protein
MADDEAKKTNNASAAITLPSPVVSATAKTRSNLSARHMLAAAYFSRKAGEIEQAHTGEPFGNFYDDIAWNVSAAVFFAVAALEADANEIFIDSYRTLPEYKEGLIDEIWNLIELKPILEKYQMVLFLKKNERFDKGESIYQDADNLIKLRNALVHFKPEWSDEKKEHIKIENRLKGKFQLSPFLVSDTEFFPKKCMSHGCAEWAVKTALAFREFFSSKSGLENRFVPFMNQLNTR